MQIVTNSCFNLSFLSHPAHFYAFLLPSLIRWFSFTLSSNHRALTAILSVFLYPSPPFPVLLSLRELIASSFVLGEQQGTMVEWGLSLWQQAWDKRERVRDKEGRRGEIARAQRGCWLLAGQQGRARWLIILVSIHNAIRPRRTPP